MSDKLAGGVKAGSTSVSIPVLLRKKVDNTELTGIAFGTSGNIASYQRQGAARVAISMATQTVTGAWSSGGFVEIDATNMPGLYRFDVPDAAFASGVDWVVVSLVTTSGYTFFQMFALETVGAAELGTRLPAALTSDGNIKADALRLGGTVQTGRDVGASVLLSSGSGTGQLDFTSGVVKANLTQILATALTETSGQIAAAFKKFFDKASPTGTVNSLPDAVAGATGGVFIAGTNAATSITTALTANITGNITGNLSGSVGSLTTNNDKTGYGLSAAAVQAIWDALTSALTTVGSIGKLLVDNVNATISSRLASGSYTAPPSAASIVAALMAEALTNGKTFEEYMEDLWAVVVGNAVADDATDPTEITYADPAGDVLRTHTLTSTTRETD